MEEYQEFFRIGQYTDTEAMTGCTVILCEDGVTGGVSVRGGSPNTRDTDALKSENNRKFVHGVTLSGGSAFGLAANAGVVDFLEKHKIGRDMGITYIPNVVGASLFDLRIGRFDVRPDFQAGYKACEQAFNNQTFQLGNYGAGTGCSVGTINGERNAMKGGIGLHTMRHKKLWVTAVVAVNAVGDVYDEALGKIIAGARKPGEQKIGFSEALFLEHYQNEQALFDGNTVIGCIMTNATFSKAKMNKLADLSHNGIARAIRPAHTTYDGDTLFVLGANQIETSFEAVSILAVEAVRQAILKGTKAAKTYGDYLAYRDI
ncbi:P1 family peptidase [Enterococcus xiangfangensis]|uniref:P1 family peptidase n=1 Tax=Enterococcus xiangfangensis TaxID=1296537 RepID=UPI0010F64B79|nr:P1 family peptidase [Enterococcus xiangfangensis]MBM7710802.1 L-aminopeptidase/D-esterase-like protein [Enterococcus xiangfangensis]